MIVTTIDKDDVINLMITVMEEDPGKVILARQDAEQMMAAGDWTDVGSIYDMMAEEVIYQFMDANRVSLPEYVAVLDDPADNQYVNDQLSHWFEGKRA